jgi:cell division protease FtsH
MGPAPYDLINSGDINVSMDDIVGHDKAKKTLSHALKKAKYPNVFNFLNAGNPDANQSMVMLMGPPGGGKTLLAKAVAAQGGATYISTSGSRFVNGLVGGGANAIRRLRDGIEQAPDDMVVLFIDELDALGSRSGMGGEMGASGSEDLKTINEFLAFTDGVKKIGNKRLLLIGATNRPEALDPAILSRFNQKVEIKELDGKQRAEVLQKQMQQKNLQADQTVDIRALSKRMKDFSGRDIRNLVMNVQEKLESHLAEDEEQLAKYENDENALQSVKLTVSHKDLMEGIREIKRSKRQIDKNGESGEYGGGKQENGGRKMYAITG